MNESGTNPSTTSNSNTSLNLNIKLVQDEPNNQDLLASKENQIESSKTSFKNAYKSSRSGHKRISLACMLCRRKKIKCDSGLPQCLNCKNRGAQCIYAKERKRGRPPRVYTYGDLIPPGKPIAPEIQSAIEDAIINSNLLNSNIASSLTIDRGDSSPTSKSLASKIYKKEDHIASDINPSDSILFHEKNSLEFINSSYDTENSNSCSANVFGGVRSHYKDDINERQRLGPSHNTDIRMDGILADSEVNFPYRNSIKMTDNEALSTKYPFTPLDSYFQEVIPCEASDRFSNLFLSNAPIFNRDLFLKSVSNKTISPILWLAVLASGSNDLDFGLKCARMCLNHVLLGSTSSVHFQDPYHCLAQSQTLFVLSTFYFLISDYSTSFILIQKASDYIINGNLVSIDFKKRESSSSYSFFQNNKNPKHLSNITDKEFYEGVRRICWMIFVLDRKISLVSGHSPSLSLSVESVNFPEENPEWDFGVNPDSKSAKENQEPYQSFLVRSFQQAVSTGGSSGAKKIIRNESFDCLPTKSSFLGKCVILKYISFAIKLDRLFKLFKDIDDILIPSNSASNSYLVSNSNNTRRDSMNSSNPNIYSSNCLNFESINQNSLKKGSYFSNLVSPGVNSNSINESPDRSNLHLLQELNRQFLTWLESSMCTSENGTFLKPFNPSPRSQPYSHIDHTIEFCERLSFNKISMFSYVSMSFDLVLGADYKSIISNPSDECKPWIKFFVSTMHQSKNKQLDSFLFKKNVNQNSNLFNTPDSVGGISEKQKSLILDTTSLLISSTFYKLFFESDQYTISPSISRNINKLLVNRINDTFLCIKSLGSEEPYFHLPDLIFDSAVINPQRFARHTNLPPNLNDVYQKNPSIPQKVSAHNQYDSVNSSLGFRLESLKYWKKSVDLAFFTAASCADYARTLAFASVLTINLTKNLPDSLPQSASNYSSSALECLRYNIDSPLVILSSARVLTTCYSMYPIMEAADACITGHNDFEYGSTHLKLKRVNFKNSNSLKKTPDNCNDNKPAVWYVFNDSDKAHSKDDYKAGFRSQDNKPPFLNDRSEQTNEFISNLLMPYRISDILHGLAAVLSLMESMRAYWNFDLELSKFEKLISNIQDQGRGETNKKSGCSSSYPSDSSQKPGIFDSNHYSNEISSDNDILELNQETRVNTTRNSIDSRSSEEILGSTQFIHSAGNGDQGLKNDFAKRMSQLDRFNKPNSADFDVDQGDQSIHQRLSSSFSHSLKSKGSISSKDSLPAMKDSRHYMSIKNNLIHFDKSGYYKRGESTLAQPLDGSEINLQGHNKKYFQKEPPNRIPQHDIFSGHEHFKNTSIDFLRNNESQLSNTRLPKYQTSGYPTNFNPLSQIRKEGNGNRALDTTNSDFEINDTQALYSQKTNTTEKSIERKRSFPHKDFTVHENKKYNPRKESFDKPFHSSSSRNADDIYGHVYKRYDTNIHPPCESDQFSHSPERGLDCDVPVTIELKPASNETFSKHENGKTNLPSIKTLGL
ncbi:hypothetical protein AYI68_g308 [Smittium mucronatum]|uniref:Zn(2)-C6 fungal-type domain-containing protein n=1 Tax=Smittium mucronatum TaxID=133383 RepID=A0A1R0H8S1_9FUNG|nr:hypothetical protein AYI68_g308 [Smittium mucronatum]